MLPSLGNPLTTSIAPNTPPIDMVEEIKMVEHIIINQSDWNKYKM